jgi:dipeptidyl-peptidase-4
LRVDARTGAVTVLAPATALVDSGGKRFTVESMRLSADETKALLFHNSVRVWRSNTRGVYHVIDFATQRLTPLSTRPGLQMFASFSPDGRSAAFVRENNLYVTDLATGAERALTMDGSADIINGTTDWAYEEELGLREAFRWSPDSRRIAFWRFDQSSITPYPLEDVMSLNPRVVTIRYPLAGAPNSSVRVGVLEVPSVVGEQHPATWLDVGGDTGIYVTRMSWLGPDSLLIQRLPRRQNRVDLLVRSAITGQGRTLVSDADSAYVDAREQPMWLNGGREFLWMSDRSGWRQVYLYSRSGALLRQLTADGHDVLSIAGVDSAHASVYVEEAAPDATERQIYRYQLAGPSGGNSAAMSGIRVTPTAGSHAWTLAPGAHYAIDISSRLSGPPVATLIELPSGTPVRTLVDNAVLIRRMAALAVRPPDYLKVPMPDGTVLDGWRIAPANFDSAKKYPVLMYVYGGPAAPTVVDQWGGRNYLWHQSLAQLGYIVVSVDNRGAAWRGRDFRKVTQFRLGVREAQDQLDVARWLGRQSWGDATRIGIWGWSFGGYLTTMTAGQGGSLFKAAIAVAPVTDWRLYDSIYTERYDGTPQDNAAGYAAGSSQAQVSGLRATLFLVYGTGDDNVHPQNSLQYANALEAAGKDFTMLAYPNRTHAIAGGNSQAHLFESLTRFLTEHL